MIRRTLTAAMIGAVRLYQLALSPLLGGQCRYRPTCSVYAIEALREHGPFRGGWMAAWRVLRCHPFSKGGYDPVRPVAGEAAPAEPDAGDR